MFGKKEERQPAASVELMPLTDEVIEEETEEELAHQEIEDAVEGVDEEDFEDQPIVREEEPEMERNNMVYDPESPLQYSEAPAATDAVDEVNLWNVLKLLVNHKADDFLMMYVPDYDVNKDVTTTLFGTFGSDQDLLDCFRLYLAIMYGLQRGDIVKIEHHIGGTDSEPDKYVQSAAVVINRPNTEVNVSINAIEVYDMVAGETFTLDENLKIIEILGLSVTPDSLKAMMTEKFGE